MRKTQTITVDTLRQLMTYDPGSGRLFWLHRSVDYFTSATQHKVWNTRFAGKEAFTADCGIGYRQGAVLGVMLKAHRVCWALHYGSWPAGQLDHINHDRSDNRIQNLRDVPTSANCRNRSLPANNSSGFIGVRRVGNRWTARAKIGGVDHYLGSFPSQAEAVSARLEFNKQNNFHPNHGG